MSRRTSKSIKEHKNESKNIEMN